MNRLGMIGLAAVIVAGMASGSRAQFSYLNEDALSRLADNQAAPLDSVPVASYRYYVVPESNRNWARQGLYRRVGHTGDSGRKELIQLLNRNFPPIESLSKGDTLVLPLDFEMDLRAYTPFPRRYEGAAEIDKLFVIDKTLQVFGAYEYGTLVRWGIVSTGDTETKTPSGRFNFNWRAKERVSSLSPPGEQWTMHWVMNFHHERGIHVHQYPLPVGGPVSHGCVRTTEADAKWLFNWADTWRWRNESLVGQGTTVIVIGEEPNRPQPFAFTEEGPRLIPVTLPDDPMSVPPGTDQQKRFDRVRRGTASTN